MTSRRPALVVATSLVLVTSAIVALHAQAQQRSIYTSVLDKAGNPVEGLMPADFVVREDNVAREVLKVEPATTPMQIALLVDNSARSSNNIRDIRDAAAEFIKGVTGSGMKNEVAVVAVGERPTILVDYTSDQARLLKGAALFTQPNSGAYMLDGIIETSQGLKKREAARPVIVAIATNGPEFSNRYHDLVLRPLHDIGASLHVVMVGRPPTDFNTDEGRERAYVFAAGTEETGGRYDNVLAASALPARLAQVANELTHQYLVTYARPQTLIPPEHVKITSKRPDVTVRGQLAKASK